MRATSGAIAAWLLLVQSLCGADVLIINNDGYWIMSIGQTGQPTTRAIETVIDVRDGQPDKPDPPGDTIEAKVKTWSREVADPTTAAALAEVYRVSANQLRTGGLSDDQALRLVSMLTDEIIKARGAEAKDWSQWRAKVTGVLTSERQKGTFGPATLDAVSAGLLAGTDGKAIDIENLIRLIELILPLILKLLGL